jgi:hypothetical protein
MSKCPKLQLVHLTLRGSPYRDGDELLNLPSARDPGKQAWKLLCGEEVRQPFVEPSTSGTDRLYD